MLINVLTPTGVVLNVKFKISPRIANLNGRIIGFLDNGKPNFNIFVARLEELLRQDSNLGEVVHMKKGHLGAVSPLAVERMEELAGKCDAVICGMCD